MAKPNTKPFITVAAVCEKVLREPDGVFSAIRIVDILTLKEELISPPANLPEGAQTVAAIQILNLTLLVALKSGDVTGEHLIRVVMRDPNDKTIPLPPGELPVVLKGNDGANYVLTFGLPLNARSGQYWFDVLWDGDVLTSVPLKLQREDAANVSAPGAHS